MANKKPAREGGCFIWRRRESNPRPEVRLPGLYTFVPRFSLAQSLARGRVGLTPAPMRIFVLGGRGYRFGLSRYSDGLPGRRGKAPPEAGLLTN